MQVFINSQEADILNTSFQFMRYSPVFVAEGIKGETSYPITFPWTERNLQIFEFINDTTIKSKTTNWEIKVLDDDFEIIGELNITNISDKGVKGNIISNISTMFSSLSKLLKNVDFGGNIEGSSEASRPNEVLIANYQALYANPQIPYRFARPWNYIQAYNLNSFKDAQEGIKKYHLDPTQHVMNFFNPVPNLSLIYTSRYGMLKHSPNYNNFASPYVIYLLEKIFEELGFTLSGSFYKHPDIMKILLFSINAQPYGVDISKSVPQNKTIADFLNMLAKKFNVGYYIDMASKTVNINFNTDVLNYTKIHDWSNKVAKGFSQNPKSDPSFQLISFIDSNDTYGSQYNLDITKFDSIPSVNTFLDLPPWVSVNSIRLVLDTNKYYIYSYNDAIEMNSWQFFSYPSDDIIVNEGSLDISANCNRIMNDSFEFFMPTFSYSGFINPDYAVGAYTTNINLPFVGYKCNNPRILDENSNPLTDAESDFALIYWHGFSEIEGYNNIGKLIYPFASQSNKLPDGSSNADFSLYQKGDEGTYKKFWQPFCENLDLKNPLSKEVYLTSAELQALDFTEPVIIDNEMFFIFSTKATYPIKKTTTVELVRYFPTQNNEAI